MVETGKWETERGAATRDDTKYPVHLDNQRPRGRPIPAWTENTGVGSSPLDEEDKFYAQIQVGTRHELVSDLSVQFENDSIYRIATGKQAPLNGPFDILVIGNPFHKPAEIAIISEVQTLEPAEILISVMCLDYPYFYQQLFPLLKRFFYQKIYRMFFPKTPLYYGSKSWGHESPSTSVPCSQKEKKLKGWG